MSFVYFQISLIDRLNTIFMNTVWHDSPDQPGITNMGFVIKKILIHGSPSKQKDHYNSDTAEWSSVERLLQVQLLHVVLNPTVEIELVLRTCLLMFEHFLSQGRRLRDSHDTCPACYGL